MFVLMTLSGGGNSRICVSGLAGNKICYEVFENVRLII